MALVYVAQCVPNGKLYFGITVQTLSRRRNRHESFARRGSSYKFHRAIAKYGQSNFVWFEIGHTSWDDACEIERALIDHFHTTCDGYNTTAGGEGSFGVHPSSETKRKLSISVSRTMTPEHRARLAALKIGSNASPSTRAKMSDAHLGLTKSAESRAKMSAAKTKYSDSRKTEATAFAAVHGFRAAERVYGISRVTIRRWTWEPERAETERLRMLARAKQRDALKRESSCSSVT